MTREEFEEALSEFGKTFGEEASCFDQGCFFSNREREELRSQIMAEFDNLTIQANAPCPECGDRGKTEPEPEPEPEPECDICDDTGIIKFGYASGWSCGCKKGLEIDEGMKHL